MLHAFPADINPFSANAADSVAALERTRGRARVYAADLMARDPLVTTPDAPIESAARIMRDRKIGALPVVSQHTLVGLITESDIFRAMVEVFEAPERAVRITFSLEPGEDVLPLVAEIARRRAHARHQFHGAAAARAAGMRGAARGRDRGRGARGRVEIAAPRDERGAAWLPSGEETGPDYLTTLSCGRRLPSSGGAGLVGGSGPRSCSENTMPSPVSRA